MRYALSPRDNPENTERTPRHRPNQKKCILLRLRPLTCLALASGLAISSVPSVPSRIPGPSTPFTSPLLNGVPSRVSRFPPLSSLVLGVNSPSQFPAYWLCSRGYPREKSPFLPEKSPQKVIFICSIQNNSVSLHPKA